MYESPINIIYGQMQMELENEVFKAVQDVNVEVDRDELIMALQYDRGQYEKGFADGRAAGARDALEWISVEERLPEKDVNVLVFAEGYADGFIGDTVTAISKRYIFRLFPWCDGELKWMAPWQYFHSDYKITHWMPLPKPPEGGDGE